MFSGPRCSRAAGSADGRTADDLPLLLARALAQVPHARPERDLAAVLQDQPLEDQCQLGAAEARRELDVGFFGTRLDRATPKEREYLQAMAELGEEPVRTGAVAGHLGKRAGNLSVARDQLLKKGLIYSPDRGYVAFTVPRFGEFILSRAD